MTDPLIQTVNVTSATSTQILNSDGDLLAEIDMQLPANLIEAEGVRKAQMSVMKMSVPLCKIPQVEVPLRMGGDINTDYTRYDIETDLCGSVFVGYKAPDLQVFIDASNTRSNCIKPNRETRGVYALTAVNRIQEVHMEPRIIKQKENEKGYHTFDTIADFINFFNDFLHRILVENSLDTTSSLPQIYFELNANNTLTLKCIPVLTRQTEVIIPFCDHPLNPYERIPYFLKFSENGQTWEPFVIDSQMSSIFFIFNRRVVDLIPILPWKKVKVSEVPFGPGEANWPDDYYYVLDTSCASVEINQMSIETFNPANAPAIFQKTSPINFHFQESEAISLSNISSIVVLMRGVGFNQPVYPVNFVGTGDPTQAQTSQIPIIEVYYPFWTGTSDVSSDLVISKTNFRDSIPITVSPNMFKERHIRFKLYYVTKNGYLREVVIPFSKTFTMQIAFALW